MRRTVPAALLAAALLVGTAVPAFAGSERSAPFAFADRLVIAHACGIVEVTDMTVRGRAHFDASGAWLRDLVTFHYDSTFTSTVGGGSLHVTTTQTAEFSPDGGVLRGQGVFIHGGGIGVAFFDVGRLRFAPDGSTLSATPKALPFDDPAGWEALEAALCGLLG